MKKIPISTYRLQLGPRFGFAAAARVVPYLHELGITHLYLSPPFQSAPGSEHGYDVIDHNRLRDELGGPEGFTALAEAVAAHGMGMLVDFVPNHMGIGQYNAWWMDVLENGPSSVYAPFFDIDWQPVKDELLHKVLLPLLGDFFGEVLERGELRVMRDGGVFALAYFDHRFPIAPRAVPLLLRHRLGELEAELGAGDLHLAELQSIIASLEKLAPRHEVDSANVAERAREKEVAKRRLAVLFEAAPRIREHVDRNLVEFNGRPGEPASFDLLEQLLGNEAYRLAHWRVAGEEINYRRFFDVNSLAAIRMEDDRVFEETHHLVLRLHAEGKIDGLRIDHPDGLYAPTTYFRKLREASGGDLYLVVEKILEGTERMPGSWAVDGTTGYEFLNALNGLFVDGRNARAFDALYGRFVGERVEWDDLVYRSKILILRSSMASQINMLAHRLNRISEENRRTRDFTLNALSRAIVEYVACLPIYRTYVEGTGPESVDARDRRYIETTIHRARRRAAAISTSVFDFLRKVLLLEQGDGPARVEFVRKLQQITGPVTAKALEDTAFYVYHRLVSLNEVGGDPARFGAEPAAFHRLNAARLADWPGSLNATSTHDTKRSEDVRLRIDALSEIPAEWTERLRRWARLNRPKKTVIDGTPAPDRNDELLVYQTLIGMYPDGDPDETVGERLVAYLEKALREAKVHSSWTNPDPGYEGAVAAFARALVGSSTFLADFVPFQRRIAAAARISSLAQTALKVASPGVADVYQGCELIDLSLVDPDNRRPVDFARRARLVRELAYPTLAARDVDGDGDHAATGPATGAAAGTAAAGSAAPGSAAAGSDPAGNDAATGLALGGAPDVGAAVSDSDEAGGRAKLLLLRETLRFRRTHPDLFLRGEYLPLPVEGPDAPHVVALARRLGGGGDQALCVVPRLILSRRRRSWEGRVRVAELAPRFTCLVSGQKLEPHDGWLSLARCFAAFPVLFASGSTD
jgi:(1->4)-alpha-D-glucan 1-alpha-D-glucosylmutase